MTKIVKLSFYALLLAATILCLSRTIADFDLWAHIKFGLDFLEAGHVIKADPYSYLTAGIAWINHEWLSEAIMGAFYKLGGSFAISFLRLSICTCIFTLLFRQLNRAKVPPLAVGLIAILLLLLISPGLSPARPQMFSYLLFAVELILLELAESTSPKALYFLPPLFALWINLHGGVLAGFAVLLIWASAKAFNWQSGKLLLSENKDWFFAALISLWFLGFTPYGFGLFSFLLKTATLPRPEITEWQPLQVGSLTGAIYTVLFFSAIWLISKNMLAKKPAQALALMVCLMLPFMATRHLGFAALAFFFLTAAEIGQVFSDNPFWKKQLSIPESLGKSNFTALVFALTTIALLVAAAPRMKSIKLSNDMPIVAVNLLEKSHASGNLACFFDWGSYCLWHLSPQIKVSLDGRRETCYGVKAYRENIDFNYGVENWQALLSDHTDMCLVSKNTASFALMSLLPDWKLAYEDTNSALFARNESQQYRLLIEARRSLANLPKEIFFP